jgi:hypothetical protein
MLNASADCIYMFTSLFFGRLFLVGQFATDAWFVSGISTVQVYLPVYGFTELCYSCYFFCRH